MKVVRARVLGFCMGVRRAVDLATDEAKRSSSCGASSYTIGPLIHNPKVLSDLASLGMRPVDLPGECGENSTVVIRAHGINPETEKELFSLGAHIVDATCPNVKASQLKAEEYARAGYGIFLAGEANHAEIEGIVGYAKSCGAFFCEVAGNTSEASKAAKKLYAINHDSRSVLLGQTTLCENEYAAIGEAIKMFFPNLEVIQTICYATKERQNALRDLLDQVDAVIVAGGRQSANTRRLLSIAQNSGKPCVIAEDYTEIPESFFSYGTVGLCAGASTPDFVIDEIENKLVSWNI